MWFFPQGSNLNRSKDVPNGGVLYFFRLHMDGTNFIPVVRGAAG